MKFITKYRLLLFKRYFDTGFGLTSYLKYFIAFFGLASRNVEAILWITFIYGILCFILGFLWFKYKWVLVEQEISNRFNLFVREMRRKI